MRLPWRRAKAEVPAEAPQTAPEGSEQAFGRRGALGPVSEPPAPSQPVASPGLRLIAKRAGIDPSRLAQAIDDPTRQHITLAEVKRLGSVWSRVPRSVVLEWVPKIDAAIDIAIAHKKEKERTNSNAP